MSLLRKLFFFFSSGNVLYDDDLLLTIGSLFNGLKNSSLSSILNGFLNLRPLIQLLNPNRLVNS